MIENKISNSKCNRGNGFTLIEIIVVITLLMVLASISIPRYANMVDNQKIKIDGTTAIQLANIAESWYIENKSLNNYDESKLQAYIENVYGENNPKSQYIKGKLFKVTLNNGRATVMLENIEFVKDGVFNEDSIIIN